MRRAGFHQVQFGDFASGDVDALDAAGGVIGCGIARHGPVGGAAQGVAGGFVRGRDPARLAGCDRAR